MKKNTWRQCRAMAASNQRAQEQSALVEAALETVVDAIDRAGLSDSTAIIYCADHGDAVGSNGGVANKVD